LFLAAAMTSLKDIRLFTTQPHKCSYLPDQEAQTLFIDPEFQVEQSHNSRLSEIGFRRSGSHVYRPNCKNCQQCLSCRVLVQQFELNRRFDRVLKRNSDVEVAEVDSIIDDEYFLLYKHYIAVRHGDGDMYPPSREQFEAFLLKRCDGTQYFTLRAKGRLLGVLVTDRLENGLSAVYTFFDPLEEKRSLGTFGGVAAEAGLDLFRLLAVSPAGTVEPGTLRTGQYQGTFVIEQDGDVSFIVTPVPEPATMVAGLALGAVATLTRRRRRGQTAATAA
jgi:arginine-tRNA-protein transferase